MLERNERSRTSNIFFHPRTKSQSITERLVDNPMKTYENGADGEPLNREPKPQILLQKFVQLSTLSSKVHVSLNLDSPVS